MTSYCINFDDVKAAAKRIDGTAHRTAVLTSSTINEIAGNNIQLFFKVEALQKTGSFKFRGALNAIRTIMEENEKNDEKNDDNSKAELHVVTHSSGNHAQALALAAKLSCTETCTVKATIVMPESTPIVKKDAVIAYGGIPIMTENTNEAREAEADRIKNETGAIFIHPSEDPRVIAGQGTVCLEFIEQINEMGYDDKLDVIIIPVGGGGLASGNIITLRALLGDTIKIVLAEPVELDDAKRSFYTKELLKHKPDNKLNSVADGLKTTLGPNTWPIIRDMVNDIYTVSENDILIATKLIWSRLKICIEPSAGVGVAVALLSKSFQEKYYNNNNSNKSTNNIGIILCGGNVDVVKVTDIMKEKNI